jgi:hypothetical protein
MGELTILGVRHHSPACARLCARLIAERRPRYVLIEGPSDMNERMGELQLEHTPPVAVYSYHLAEGVAARGTWSPFCAYSPEWVALREAAAHDAEALFIDLPAWHDAFLAVENRYADHRGRDVHGRLLELARAHGFDSTDTVWDHLFEQHRPDDDERLEAELARYFDAYRGEDPAGERDGPREEHMARWIAWAMHQTRTSTRGVLVVCGGWHAPALRRLWPSVRERDAVPEASRPTLDAPEGRTGSYLVPYSFHRLDSFTGYAAGMPSPGYYQAVWELGARAPEHMLHLAARRLRERGQRVSTADLLAASEACESLARLRGHATPTRCDVLDAMLGAFVKDALSQPPPWAERAALAPGTDPLLVEIVAAFSGSARGALAPQTPRPPLSADVAATLDRLGLSLEPTARELALDPLDPAHRERRCVLFRLLVLEVPGVARVAAADFSRGSTRSTERWRLVHLLETDATLIERAVYGADLESAALAKLRELVSEAERAGALVLALERAVLCGLAGTLDELVLRAAAAIAREPALGESGVALERLLVLVRTEPAVSLRLAPLLEQTAERTAWLLEGRDGPDAPIVQDELRAVSALAGTIKDVAAGRGALAAEPLAAVFARRARAESAPPWLRGACLGALWALGAQREILSDVVDEEAARRVIAALQTRHLGDFLAGLFALAREEFLASRLLELVDARLAALDEGAFLGGLPALRGAFATFPPRERLAIATRLVRARGASNEPAELLSPIAAPEALARGAAWESAALELCAKYGLWERST